MTLNYQKLLEEYDFHTQQQLRFTRDADILSVLWESKKDREHIRNEIVIQTQLNAGEETC